MNVSNITAAEKRVADFLGAPKKLLIGGKWADAVSGETFEVENPATGEIIAHVPAGQKADIDLAVAAARKAMDGPWSKMVPAERARLLWKLSDMLEAQAEEFALIETLDNGKPYRNALNMDLKTCVENLRYNAGWATKLNGETMTPSNPANLLAYTLREPVGVVGLIVPWNFPLTMAVNKMAPALAAGNVVILKPAEQTPLTALRLGQLVQEAGLPEGVVNIVTGFGHTAGAALTEHPGVDKISFTGSTEVGRTILKASGGNFKRLMLELGGKSPVIVFPDADMNKAIEGAARGIFSNSGQVCAANSRLYAHRDVFDRVVEGIAERAQKLKVGIGTAPDTEIGPVVSRKQMERVLNYVDLGRNDGASVVTGGRQRGSEGYFVEPTVLVETRNDMRVVQEEIFGPVLCAMSFDLDDIDRIAAEANDTIYGLNASIWTQNITVAHLMARKIKAGMVRINGGGVDHALPFGGYKQSGWGREYGREGVEAYTELKTVAIAM
ncbi:MAG TPA: aldehyde dehydrogenase family protein [Rhizobiaceae bacterium]|nr:aldehyde dehydrogenase family protein [Rhizobiaceae bacterium]